MPKILHTDIHQKWTGYGICIKHLSEMKPQYIRYSVLQTKFKFVDEALPLFGYSRLQETVVEDSTKRAKKKQQK